MATTITLKKALKEKKKLIKKLEETFQKVHLNNVHDTEIPSAVNKEQLYQDWLKTRDELISLKIKIHTATAPVYDKIVKLGELKSFINSMRVIKNQAREGKVRTSSSESGFIEYSCFINRDKAEEIIKEAEDQIEQLQEELDAFNSITTI